MAGSCGASPTSPSQPRRPQWRNDTDCDQGIDMNRTMRKTVLAGAALLASLAAASPAAACLRTFEVRFEPGATQAADKSSIAGFLSVPTYGNGQMIVVRVSAPVHDLARRRAQALSDLLEAQGLSPSGIMIETSRKPVERAVLVVYPPPTIRPDPVLAQATPPTPPRRPCGG